jgi:putative oxidoreductase
MLVAGLSADLSARERAASQGEGESNNLANRDESSCRPERTHGFEYTLFRRGVKVPVRRAPAPAVAPFTSIPECMTAFSIPLTDRAVSRLEGPLLSVLRIVVGFLFLCHGVSKLFGVLSGPPGPAHMGPVSPTAWPVGIAGCIELVGGTLLILGLFTRVAAFICAGEMAVAYFMVHAPRGFFPIENRGELPVIFCFVSLYLAFTGGGPYSLDALLRRGANGPSLTT